jgi:hypothetical protein
VIGGEWLVRSSATGWAETTHAAVHGGDELAADDQDLLGAPAVAAAVARDRARLVVLGSVRSLSSVLVDAQYFGAQTLALAAINWLAGTLVAPVDNARPARRLRLVMTPTERTRAFWLCVVVLPAVFAFVGAVVWWRRRGA